MRVLIIAGLLLALAGCADVPQSHGYVLLSNKMEEQSQFRLYRNELNSGDIALLRGKINFADQEMAATMIDDYYFDGTGLTRHPGKVKAANDYLLNPAASGLPLGNAVAGK